MMAKHSGRVSEGPGVRRMKCVGTNLPAPGHFSAVWTWRADGLQRTAGIT